ncbi:MAG TPA: response regulator [Methylomirabilota bacterium]|jgi:CheY-like chemotaxis protein|nr:response regulator [Methylomirabilota bacterium]
MTDLGTAARLRAAFELSPTILAVSGLDDGRLLEVNDAFLRITGWTREEIIVRLPATAEVDAPSQPALSAAATLPPRCRRVLIVEDHEDARESLRLMLELAGHEVETAGDGPSGLATLLSSRPDIALIDVGLPGIDGYDVVRRARSFVRETCLVALTGYGQADDQRKAREAGFDVHITKPVDPDRLERLLRTLTKVG